MNCEMSITTHSNKEFSPSSDLSLGNNSLFLSEALNFESDEDPNDEWHYNVLPLDSHQINSNTNENEPAREPGMKITYMQLSLYELAAYDQFKRKCRDIAYMSEDELYLAFIIAYGIYNYGNSLIKQINEEKENWQKGQEAQSEAEARISAEWKYVHLDERYILVKGQYWSRFNGFMNLNNSLFPIGEFAPRCNRCSTFGIFRGLISCYIIANMKGHPYQCMTELCSHCFWLYRKIQLNTTANMRFTTEFLEFVYSPENLQHMTQTNSLLYQDVPKGSVYPETNIGVKPYDSKLVYGLFKTMEYPTNPPRSIRSSDLIPEWNASTLYETELIVQDQDRQTRKRTYVDDFANELYNEDNKSQKVSHTFDADIQQILLSGDNYERSILRKKVVGLEVFNHPNPKKSNARKPHPKKSNPKKSNARKPKK